MKRRIAAAWLATAALISVAGFPNGQVAAGEGPDHAASSREDASSDVTVPRRVKWVPPDIPEFLLQRRLKATVTLQATIQASGAVNNITTLQCEVTRRKKPDPKLAKYCPAFEKAATDAVRQWTYEPAMQNGKPIPIYFTIRVDFNRG